MKRLLLIVCFLWAACGSDPDPPDTNPGDPDAAPLPTSSFEDPLVPLGSLPAQGVIEIEEIRALDDGRLLYCTREQGVIMVDASDPANLQETGRIDTGPCQHLAISGDTLYVTHRGTVAVPTSQLQAYDLSQSPPTQLATFEAADTSFEGIVADGDLVYAAVHERGVVIVERTGNAMAERGALTTGFVNAWGVTKRGDVLYVADAGAGLVTVDVSNPAAPSRLGSVPIDGSAMSIEVSDDGATAYIGAGYGGVFSVHVQSPDTPVLLNQQRTRISAFQVSLAGDFLYAADWRAVRVYDTTDPSFLQLVATEMPQTEQVTPRIRAVAARGDRVFVGEWTAVHALELQPNPLAPSLWVQATEVPFYNVPVGSPRAFALIVENEGRASLSIGVEIEGAAFSTSRETIALDSLDAAVVEVTYQPPDNGTHVGAVVLRSDDPDQAELRIPIVGNAPYPQVGDPAPEIAVSMIYGGEWRTSQQQGVIQVLSYFSVF